MIRKTISITSLAILVAAISVVTTMTMVQADSTGDFVDINVPTADTTDLNVQITGAVEYTSFIGNGGHPITVDIDGGAGTLLIDLTSGPSIGADDPIVVTISDIQWVGETGAIGSFSCSLDDGATATPVFNKDTLKVTITGGVHDTPIDIDCEFVAFHGEINKTDTTEEGCGPIGIKETFETPCSFNISYTGSTAIIRDTVPAEWRVDDVENEDDDCNFEQANKGKKINRSATKITCVDVEDVDSEFFVDTRQSPSGKQKFKPTQCGTFFLNDGAVAFLSDGSGEIVIGTLDDLPIVLDSTAALEVTADDSGLFGCDGELKD